MPVMPQEGLSLSSLPSVVIGMIVRMSDNDCSKEMRLISPSWNSDVVDRRQQRERARLALPVIAAFSVKEYPRCKLYADVYTKVVDNEYFTANGSNVKQDDSATLIGAEDLFCGHFMLTSLFLSLFLYPISVPQIFPLFVFAVWFKLSWLRKPTIDNDVEVLLKLTSRRIEELCLFDFSEYAFLFFREIVTKTRVDRINLTVDNFDNSIRRALMETVKAYSAYDVDITAKCCSPDGLKQYLIELSRTVSVIRIEQKDAINPVNTLFGLDLEWWNAMSKELVNMETMSVISKEGKIRIVFRAPLLDFMTTFDDDDWNI